MAAIGVTNQRETTILWEDSSGKPVANAIVWQSRVTAGAVRSTQGRRTTKTTFREQDGPRRRRLFLRHQDRPPARHDPRIAGPRAEKGEILFGTVDTFLTWRLTGGKRHVTDYSNASRTLIYNIHTLDWDDELLLILKIPRAMLPEVQPSSKSMARRIVRCFGARIPIASLIGDQQAATFGQGCFEPGAGRRTPTAPAASC